MKHFTIFTILLLVSTIVVFAQENTTNVTIPPVEVPALVCKVGQCDKGCVKCSDKMCHDPGFICTEELTLDRFFPNKVSVGETQLNIVLRNTGTVALENIHSIISGDGISMLDKIPVQKLSPGDKDYVFAKINASKSGNIDIILKIYVNDVLKFKYVDQLVVAEPIKVIQTDVVNVTLLNSNFNQLKQKYKTLEQIYQDKKSQGYPVELVYDNLRAVFNHITETQSFLLQGDYKKAETGMGIISTSLADVEEQVNSVQKEKESLSDKVKNNLLFFGSLAAALVSIFTAYKFVQGSINRKKLLGLHKKLTSKKKGKKK